MTERPYGVHAIWDVYHPDVGAQMPDGRWVAACAEPYDGNRLRAAWWVLTGRAYAMLWPKAGDLEDIWRRKPKNLDRPPRPFISQQTAIVGDTLLRPPTRVTLPDDPAERVRITREGADIMNRLKEPKTVTDKP